MIKTYISEVDKGRIVSIVNNKMEEEKEIKEGEDAEANTPETPTEETLTV